MAGVCFASAFVFLICDFHKSILKRFNDAWSAPWLIQYFMASFISVKKTPPIEFLIFSTVLQFCQPNFVFCITVYNIVDSYVQICL